MCIEYGELDWNQNGSINIDIMLHTARVDWCMKLHLEREPGTVM